MNSISVPFDQMAEPFTAVVSALPSHAWSAPSPCEGWTARDVLDHVVATQREFFAQHGIDLTGAPDPSAPPAQGWSEHLTAVRATVADESTMSREFEGYFGPTTIGATLLGFYGFDLLVHRWDIAAAAGQDERFTEPELDTMQAVIDGSGDSLYQDGICKPPVPVADQADRQTQVLARLGRSPRTTPTAGEQSPTAAPL